MKGTRLSRAKGVFTASLLFAAVAALGCAQSAAPAAQQPAAAKAPTKITFIIANPEISTAYAPVSSMPAGLGYWKDEGLDVEVQPAKGAAEALQALVTGSAQFYYGSPSVLMIGHSDSGAAVTSYYQAAFQNYYSFAVLPDSPINSIKDLKGKKVGNQGAGSQGEIQVNAFAKAEGLDPKKDLEQVPIGIGAPAAIALTEKRVDAIYLADLHYAAMENLGYKFKHFVSPAADVLAFGAVVGGADKFIAANPDAAARFYRGIAKGTLFALTNPEAATKLHYKVFPESKPTGIDDAKAISQGKVVMGTRLESMKPPQGKKWGENIEDGVKKYADFLAAQGQLKKPSPVSEYFSNKLIAEANNFDPKPVEQAAKDYK